MKLGVIPINVGLTDPAAILAIAQHAEASGIESVWTFEHAMVPADYESRYPYHPSGKAGMQPETPFLDPLVTLSHVAAATTTLRFGTGVNILPQANPLLMAKQVATLDVLSQGRLHLGVGVGWLQEEFAAMGTPFARRGARFDDYLVAMKRVWSGEMVEHDGEFLQWSGFKSYPLPVQRPHPPIIVGGTSDRAFRRVALHGDGWFAPNHGVEPLEEMLERLHRVAEANDRDPSSIEVTAMWAMVKEPEALPAYEALGVTRLVVPLFATGATDPMEAIDRVVAHRS